MLTNVTTFNHTLRRHLGQVDAQGIRDRGASGPSGSSAGRKAVRVRASAAQRTGGSGARGSGWAAHRVELDLLRELVELRVWTRKCGSVCTGGGPGPGDVRVRSVVADEVGATMMAPVPRPSESRSSCFGAVSVLQVTTKSMYDLQHFLTLPSTCRESEGPSKYP